MIVKQDDLITQIKLYQEPRVQIEEQISFHIYIVSEEPNKSITKLNSGFVDSLVLTNAFLRLDYDQNNRQQQLISLCKKEYKVKSKRLNMFDEFEDHYKSDDALLWYTRESFLYRILGKALRTSNMDLLLSFHFFINDIYKQLKQNQYKSTIRVYRGQIMWSRELTYIQQSINGYFSIKSFLLTNTNRDTVLDFLNNSTIENGQHQVLFSIDADPNLTTTRTFADISKYSSHSEGSEILFMIGSIFRLIEVEDDGNIPIIHMKLCSDNEPDLKHLFETMKEQYGHAHEDNRINLQTFGDIARRLGKYDLAESIYLRALDALPSNDPIRSDLYCKLGTVSREKGDHSASLTLYKRSLEIKKRIDPTDDLDIGHLYGCVGEAYARNNNDNKALENYKKALELFQKANAEDHVHMADFYSNIGSVYKRQDNDLEALKYFNKALSIDEQHSPADRHNVAKSHNNIGNIYCKRGEYDVAMDHYQKSLKIKLNARPPQQLSIAKTHKNIGFVHQVKGDLQKALVSYQEAETIYRQLLPAQHPDVIQIKRDIQNILK